MDVFHEYSWQRWVNYFFYVPAILSKKKNDSNIRGKVKFFLCTDDFDNRKKSILRKNSY